MHLQNVFYTLLEMLNFTRKEETNLIKNSVCFDIVPFWHTLLIRDFFLAKNFCSFSSVSKNYSVLFKLLKQIFYDIFKLKGFSLLFFQQNNTPAKNRYYQVFKTYFDQNFVFSLSHAEVFMANMLPKKKQPGNYVLRLLRATSTYNQTTISSFERKNFFNFLKLHGP